jgi:MFS family permease
VYGALTGAGAAVGLLAGGLITQYLDWRWCLYVNVPIALVALIGALSAVRADTVAGKGSVDVPGALLGCGSLVALVYGFATAEASGWGSAKVLTLLAVGVLGLVAFTLTEGRIRNPLLPLHVVTHRVRGGSFLVLGLTQVAMFGFFLFMTYYFQVAFLPLAVGIVLGSTVIAGSLLNRVRIRSLMLAGLVASAAGMGLLTQLSVDTPNVFLTYLLPAELLIGTGLGCVWMPAMSTATAGVRPGDAGVAAATVNAAQQVGGALGTALLNTVATSATASYLNSHGRDGLAVTSGMVHGYSTALTVAVGVLVATTVVVIALVRRAASDGTTASAPLDAAAPDRKEEQVWGTSK